MTAAQYLIENSTLDTGTATQLLLTSNAVGFTVTLVSTMDVSLTEDIYVADAETDTYTAEIVEDVLGTDSSYDIMATDITVDEITIEGQQ